MSDAPSFLRHGSARASERNAAWLSGTIACQSIAQVSKGEPWRLLLLHDRPTHALIWITRGQGRVILNGVRRGVGAHNALVIPAGTLFSLELGPQALGQVIESPAGLTGRMPRDPMHLRGDATRDLAKPPLGARGPDGAAWIDFSLGSKAIRGRIGGYTTGNRGPKAGATLFRACGPGIPL